MSVYVDYKYYSDVFGGNLIPEVEFIRAATTASLYIDRFTYNRIKSDPSSVAGLQDCACDMAESVYKMLYLDAGAQKKSESIDGYSVSYVTAQQDGEDIRTTLTRNLYAIAALYLSGSGLLFAGVDDSYDY